MNEVLNKINELVSLLEKKIADAEVLNAQLVDKKKELAVLESKAVAKLNNASAQERIYQKYADFDEAVALFNATKVDYNKRIEEAKQQEANDKEVLKKIKEENVKLDARKAAMTKQAIAMKEREADFNKKKADLKAMISGQAIKDILK